MRKLEWEISVCVLQLTLEMVPNIAQVARAGTSEDRVRDVCASQHAKTGDQTETRAGELRIGDLHGGCH